MENLCNLILDCSIILIMHFDHSAVLLNISFDEDSPPHGPGFWKFKGHHTRGDWSQGPVAGTSPCDQVPSCVATLIIRYYSIPREYELRELILHLGLIPKLISLKLFLDMVPSSPTDVNARCVNVLACFLKTIGNAMAGNVV